MTGLIKGYVYHQPNYSLVHYRLINDNNIDNINIINNIINNNSNNILLIIIVIIILKDYDDSYDS